MKENTRGRARQTTTQLRYLLAKDGRDYLLPLVNVFALAGGALDQIIDVIGRAAIEAMLDISAADVAGEKQPGQSPDGGARRTTGGSGAGCTGGPGPPGREAPAAKPGRGRDRGPSQRGAAAPFGLGERIVELLLAGLSTRSYGKAIPLCERHCRGRSKETGAGSAS